MSFTNQELTNCHDVRISDKESLLTCMGLTPIMDIKKDRDDCEITLLTKEIVSQHCNVRISNITSELWLKLRQPNSWIYVFPLRQMVYIGCIGHPVIEQILEGTGILSIHEDCNLKTDKILIQAYKVYQHEIMLEVTPYGHLHINITETMKGLHHLNTQNIKSITTPSVITFGQNDRLKEISVGLDELLQMEDEFINHYSPYELKRGITMTNILVYIIIIVIIIIIARMIYKRFHNHLLQAISRIHFRNKVSSPSNNQDDENCNMKFKNQP